MRYHDVFNGDADGICALHQLRLADPLESRLVTGLKRDVELLARVDAQPGDVVTVLDVSLDRNREALMRLLDRGVVVRYIDHHFAGPLPRHRNLEVAIDPTGAVCTSMVVDRQLLGRFRAWAVVGAFGDALEEAAHDLAAPLALDAEQVAQLRDLGQALNYNAYGEVAADVIIPPLELYRIVSHHADPFVLAREEPIVAKIASAREADLQCALETRPLREIDSFDVYLLPDTSWSRRISGTFANRLAAKLPERAHAVVTPSTAGGYAVSVRSTPGRATSALDFCRRFPGGGGRTAAAGIDRLPRERFESFLEAFGSERWAR